MVRRNWKETGKKQESLSGNYCHYPARDRAGWVRVASPARSEDGAICKLNEQGSQIDWVWRGGCLNWGLRIKSRILPLLNEERGEGGEK